MPNVLASKLPNSGKRIEVKKSICTICDSLNQCGLDLYVKQGKIIKVEGQGESAQQGNSVRQGSFHPPVCVS